MGLLDVLRGQRAPKRANLDRLFALSTSYPTLTVNLQLETTGAAGVCVKPIEAAVFDELMRDVEGMLEVAGRESGARFSRHDDDYGFAWIVIHDPDFDDLVTTAHVVNQTIEERGFSEQLLCSVFGFRTPAGEALDMVYGYKRGSFYPFAPRGQGSRDNTLEMRVKAVLDPEMPIEQELERWYPVWGAPVEGTG